MFLNLESYSSEMDPAVHHFAPHADLFCPSALIPFFRFRTIFFYALPIFEIPPLGK